MKLFSKYFLILIVILLIISCSSINVQKTMKENTSKSFFTGLLVYNPTKNKTLIDYNSEYYFTPASTTKLFTLFTALHCLPDSISTISYHETQDKLYFKTLADPSFLYDSLPNTTYNFLKNTSKELILVPNEFYDFVYGDGWQWDDYQYYYLPEKSVFPIFGNIATLSGDKIFPTHFKNQLKEAHPKDIYRDFTQNVFYKNTVTSDSKRKIPFKTSLKLASQLLSDTLHKPISISSQLNRFEFTPYISTPTYPIYKKLMTESDNFIAEQLLLIIAKNKTNSYQVKNAIQYSLDSLLADIPNKPRWVDGSGLSRYNLFTPKSMVFLLENMLNKYGQEKLMNLLPENGKEGSLQRIYPFHETYLYAKTGTLSNNHNLSGLLITKKGTLLIFSFMNNHYMQNINEVRAYMNKVLQQIYYKY